MKFIKAFIGSVILVACFFTMSIEAQAPIRIIDLKSYSVPELIDYFGGDNKVLISKILWCESQHQNFEIWGDGHKAYGVAQYHEDTFNRYALLMGQDLEWKSQIDQVKLLSWQAQYLPKSLWEWTTYRAIKNGGIYIFVDKKGIKHTVVCK